MIGRRLEVNSLTQALKPGYIPEFVKDRRKKIRMIGVAPLGNGEYPWFGSFVCVLCENGDCLFSSQIIFIDIQIILKQNYRDEPANANLFDQKAVHNVQQ